MKLENVKVLGQYRIQKGGSIQLFIGPNMEFGTEHSTQVHEMYHMHLTNMTSFGIVLGILELERELAEKLDVKQTNRIKKFIQIMSERMLEVQEVYANNMELLWIHENVGLEFERKIYNSKTKKYQEYCDTLKIITENQTLSILEKQQQVDLICMYAMHIDLLSTEFIDSLRTERLSQYFRNEHHPSQRLKKAINLYEQGNLKTLSTSLLLDVDKFIKQIQVDGIVKHLNWEEVIVEYNKALREKGEDNDSLEHIVSHYNNLMEERIQTFDLSAIKVNRGFSFPKYDLPGIFVLKYCANLVNPDENYYLIGHIIDNGVPKYISEEFSKESTTLLIQDKLCVAVRLDEYDLDNSQPKYFDSFGKLVIVLIEDYQECNDWLNDELQKGEIYVGDLYDETVKNFFTVLFFARRNDSNTIFVFPTIKRLGKKLIENNKLKDRVLYSNQKEFLKIFSHLSNEANMLKVMHWLMIFLTNSKGEFTSHEDSATKLQFDFIRTLMDNVFQIKRQSHYQQMAALPTMFTVAKPFYALMEFENGNNTGYIKAETENQYPLFFSTKQDALQYLNYNSNLNNYRIVGIDHRYWNEVKPFLLKSKKKIYIYLYTNGLQINAEIAEIIDVDKIIK